MDRANLRVAHLVATTGATGVEAYLLTLLSRFDRRRVEPVLFVPGPGVLVDRLHAAGIPFEFGAPTRKLDFGAGTRLAKRWEGAFDLVHAHGPRAAHWAARAVRRIGLPLVITVHELRWQTLPPGPRRELWVGLERATWRRADRLITVSDATRRDLIAKDPTLAARTRVVHASTPLLLDPERVPRADLRWTPADPLRLVTVGRFSWQKGYDLLLGALASLARRGVAFRLDVVGSGALEPELRRSAAALAIDDRIAWRGPHADVPALLASAHAFVTATRAEMFGIAVLEAMAVGLPVLAPAVGSLPEVVADGETGCLVPAHPEEALQDRIADVLTSWRDAPERCAQMGADGRARAFTQFSPERLATGVADQYDELLSEARRV